MSKTHQAEYIETPNSTDMESRKLAGAARAVNHADPWTDEGHRGLTDLTVPLLSGAHNGCLRVKVTSEIRQAEMPNLARSDDHTIPVCDVIDLDTGEVALLLVSAVAQGAMQRVSGGYVGRSFQIETGDMVPGKNYRRVKVYLIPDAEQ